MKHKETCHIKCLETDCKNASLFQFKNGIVVPFEVDSVDVQKLFSYFLHCAPTIESVHSKPIVYAKHAEIFDRMVRDRHFKYHRFCSANAPIEKELTKAYLADGMICPKCKRYICKKKPTQKGMQQESDLCCFLRHLRNSIAHGRVYSIKIGKQKWYLFEDYNSSGNLSARILCVKTDLQIWKKLLSDKRIYE